jgi:hypothetical protein
MRLIIAGGRGFTDYGLLAETMYTVYDQEILGRYDTWLEIVSGKAKGADTLGEQFAKDLSIPVKEFPADWKTHSLAAGPIRNKQMGDYADELLAFWDGYSKGTLNMIQYMNKLKKPVWVRMY